MKIGKYRLVDILSPKKWWAAFKWYSTDHVKVPKDEILDIAELVIFRSKECPACVENGTCLDCGCNTMGKMVDPSEECSLGRWNSTTVENWRKTKEGLQLEFRLGRKGQ